VIVAYLAAFATALLYGVSAVVEDTAAKRIPTAGAGGRRSAVRAALSPIYLFGMVLSVVAWVSSLVALHSLPLFAVQAMSASSIGVVVLITWARTGRAPSRFEGVLLTGMGLGLVALAVSAESGHALHTGWLFRLNIWVAVAVVIVVAIRVSQVGGDRGSALLGGVSGLSDSGLALCARAMHVDPNHWLRVLTDPLAFALIPFAIVGVVAFAAALQRGAASAALACQQAVVTVVPSGIGLVVLGDRARAGFTPLTIVAFAITVSTLVVLTLSSTHRSDVELFAPADETAREV
jgi:hypothetical protein